VPHRIGFGGAVLASDGNADGNVSGQLRRRVGRRTVVDAGGDADVGVTQQLLGPADPGDDLGRHHAGHGPRPRLQVPRRQSPVRADRGCLGPLPAVRLRGLTQATSAIPEARVFDLRHSRGKVSGSIGQAPAPYGRLAGLLGRVLMLRASRREAWKRVPQYSSP